jgi:hypothetical protein
MSTNNKSKKGKSPKTWQWWIEKVAMPLLLAMIPAFVLLVTTGVIEIPTTSTQTPTPSASLPITGTWEGTTTGTNDGAPISERATTMLVPADCKVGGACGISTYEGGCAYEMTLASIQEDVYTFEIELVTGAEFCSGEKTEETIEVALASAEQVRHYFHSRNSEGNVVIREGMLTKVK